jgi:hypothetical protein
MKRAHNDVGDSSAETQTPVAKRVKTFAKVEEGVKIEVGSGDDVPLAQLAPVAVKREGNDNDGSVSENVVGSGDEVKASEEGVEQEGSAADAGELYEVHKLVGWRAGSNGGDEFRLRWKGYGIKDDT